MKLRKKLSISQRWLLLFITLIFFPTLLWVFNTLSKPSYSWYDNNWLYRTPIEITNSGSSKTNYDVLVTLDTATLILEGKIQSDCDDIRFVDSDDVTLLGYWIEGGCNTSETQIWVRIPSIAVGNKTVYIYYGNGSATSGQTSWGGNFIVMYNASCPAGWTRVDSLDDVFVRGASTYGGTGSSNTHNHGQVSGTSTGPNSTSNVNTSCDLIMAGISGHNNTKADINNVTIRPPFLNVVYSQNPDLTLSSGMISVFDATVPTGWTRFSALDSKFPRGASTYGGTGGVTSHTHTTTGGYSSGPSNDSCAPGADGNGAAAYGHSHTSLSGSTGSATNTPPYLDVIYGQINADGMAPSKSISMVTSLPPFGWTRFSALDSKFPRGASTYGGTGGATSHTHSVTVTLSTYTGGRSPKDTIGGRILSSFSHNHTYTATSTSGSNLPAYLNTIFAKKNDNSSDSISIILLSEESIVITAPTLDSPSNKETGQIFLPQLKTTSTDLIATTVQFKIELCRNKGMTIGCSTFDQTVSQTGWSGQDALVNTAYNVSTQATYTLQSPLTEGTTYYWRSYSLDTSSSNWSSTQDEPHAFIINSLPRALSSNELSAYISKREGSFSSTSIGWASITGAAESGTTPSTNGWISGSNFTVGRKYLVLLWGSHQADLGYRSGIRVKHGSTLFTESQAIEISDQAGTSYKTPYFWFTVWDGANEDLEVEIYNNGVVGDESRVEDLTLAALDMTDQINNGNLLYNISTTGGNLSETFSSKAGLTFTPATNNEIWWIMSYARGNLQDNSGENFEARLNINSQPNDPMIISSLNVDDSPIYGVGSVKELANSLQTLDLEIKRTGSNNQWHSAGIFVINLNQFESYQFDENSINQTKLTTPFEWIELSAIDLL